MKSLETFFADTADTADTADAGWRPVNPCTDPQELARLDSCYVGGGDCMVPILAVGDTLFFDRDAKAQHGDIVVFRLSRRAAADMDPNGVWQPGALDGTALWVKLLAVPDGSKTGFLVSKGGDPLTASFMASEFPTDDPPIWPLRNVWRNGRLLFGPAAGDHPKVTRRAMVLGGVFAPLALAACDGDSTPFTMLPACTEPDSSAVQDTVQIGANAATSILLVGASSTAITGTLASPQVLLSVTIPAQIAASQVVCSFVGNLTAVSAASPGCGVWAYIDVAPNVTYDATAGNARCYAAAAGATSVNAAMFEETFTQAAGSSATYNVYAFRTGGGSGATGAVSECELKGEVVKK